MTSNKDELETVLTELFSNIPIQRDNEASFPIVDFDPILKPHDMDVLAFYLDNMIDWDNVTAVVGLAERSSGALTHLVAHRRGMPYSLINWYPEGSQGGIRVGPALSFTGELGNSYLNGLTDGDVVVFIDDCLRKGSNARKVVEAARSAGVTVKSCAFVADIVGTGGKALLEDKLQVPALSLCEVVASAGSIGGTTALHKICCNLEMIYTPPRAVPTVQQVLGLSEAELCAKLVRVSQAFVGMPIYSAKNSTYPYSNFPLTDFQPMPHPDLIEDMAICMVYLSEGLKDVDVLVSEADRGGAPLAIAMARITGLPYTLANWAPPTNHNAGTKACAMVGYSGSGCLYVNGIQKGQRCALVDDMLSSGGTAEGLIRAVEAGGGVVVEAHFASEKVNTGGRIRLAKNWPKLCIYSLCYFISKGSHTVAHPPGPLAILRSKMTEDSLPNATDSLTEQPNGVTNQHLDDDSPLVPGSIQAGLVLFSGLYTMFFSGAVFGWGPMQLMLEEDGAFEFKCGKDDELPCEAQSVTLIQIQLVATLMAVFSPLVGMFTDRYGALALMYLLAFSGVSGISLVMVASVTQTSRLHFLGFAFIGLMFICTTIIIVQTGLVLPGKAQRRVISALNGLIDAGTISYLVLYEIGQATHASLVQLMGGYLGVAIFCFGGAIFYWRAVLKSAKSRTKDTPVEPETVNKTSSSKSRKQESEKRMQDSFVRDSTEMDSFHRNGERIATEDESSNKSPRGYKLIAQRDPWEQLRSEQYLLMLMFFSVHLTKNNWTLATARDYLASLGDDEEGNKYVAIFTGLSAASLIGLPFIDLLMGKYGFHSALQAINVLGIIHGILQVVSESLNVQVLGFVVFSFYRCFTFSASFSFLPTFLRGDTVGRGCGVMSFVSAAFSLLNIGLAEWAINGLGRDFFIPNLILLLLIVPTVYATYRIGNCIKREEDAARFMDKDGLLVVDQSRHSVSSFQLCKSCALQCSENQISGNTHSPGLSLHCDDVEVEG